MEKWVVLAGLAGALVLVSFSTGVRYTTSTPTQARYELPALPAAEARAATVAAVEAEGATVPRDSMIPALPAHVLERVTLVGSAERVCVSVPAERAHLVRSGEFLIGGDLPGLVHGRPVKMWWQPANSALHMELLVRGRRLGAPADTLRFTSTEITAPLDSDTHEPYVGEAAFPAAIRFPSAGQWIVVATSRRNWGCFLFDVR